MKVKLEIPEYPLPGIVQLHYAGQRGNQPGKMEKFFGQVYWVPDTPQKEADTLQAVLLESDLLLDLCPNDHAMKIWQELLLEYVRGGAPYRWDLIYLRRQSMREYAKWLDE